MPGSTVTDASDAENALAAFDDSVVINGTADSTAPTLTSATVVGTAVKLNFSESLQTTDTLTNSLFTVEYSTDAVEVGPHRRIRLQGIAVISVMVDRRLR